MKTGKYLYVLCVEALALRNKKEKKKKWRGEEKDREREKILQKTKEGGGLKASLNYFFAQEGR